MTFLTSAVVVALSGVFGAVLGGAGRVVAGLVPRGASCRPPWCELAGGVLCALLGWRACACHLPWWWLPVPLLLGCLAIPMTVVDLAHRRLPDALTLPAVPVLGLALCAAALGGHDPALGSRAVVGAVVFSGAHLLVRVVSRRAMGAGDVKLAFGLGAVLGAVGWSALVVAAVLAAVSTALLAVAARTDTAPHGPGLLAATWLVAAFPGGHPGALGAGRML
jgi:leader peptidase (prepilin peptidase)/N-methyltransferase